MPKDYCSYRVAIVGGCQCVGLGEWIRRLLPGAQVSHWHVHSSPDLTPGQILPQMAGSDLVVTQFSDEMVGGDLGPARLSEHFKNVVFMPVFVFGGFHPDIVFCGLSEEPFAFVRGPLNILQSGIALAAYHLDVPVERVPRLYNAVVFEALGYFDAFDHARSACTEVLSDQGYDVADAFDAWMREGCFMYSDNHPHIRVLRSFAEAILAKAQLMPASVAHDAVPPDLLSHSVQWPVYPALARRLGIPGSIAFTRALHAVSAGESREITLQAFVEASYGVFASVGRDRLDRVPRIMDDVARLRRLVTI